MLKGIYAQDQLRAEEELTDKFLIQNPDEAKEKLVRIFSIANEDSTQPDRMAGALYLIKTIRETCGLAFTGKSGYMKEEYGELSNLVQSASNRLIKGIRRYAEGQLDKPYSIQTRNILQALDDVGDNYSLYPKIEERVATEIGRVARELDMQTNDREISCYSGGRRIENQDDFNTKRQIRDSLKTAYDLCKLRDRRSYDDRLDLERSVGYNALMGQFLSFVSDVGKLANADFSEFENDYLGSI